MACPRACSGARILDVFRLVHRATTDVAVVSGRVRACAMPQRAGVPIYGIGGIRRSEASGGGASTPASGDSGSEHGVMLAARRWLMEYCEGQPRLAMRNADAVLHLVAE